MTSISSSISSYPSTNPYVSSLDKNGDGFVSADELAAADTSGGKPKAAPQQSDDADSDASNPIDSLTKFSTLMLSFLMQMTGGQPDASAPQDGQTQDGQKSDKPQLADLDTDGDGTVSAAEFAAGKPANVTDDKSAKLFSRLDTDGNGSLDQTELENAQKNRPAHAHHGGGHHGPQVADLDSDSDGAVSAAEFSAAKPDGVTDDMSANLFSSLDVDGNGSLDQTELDAMRKGPAQAANGTTAAQQAAQSGAQPDASTNIEDMLTELQNFAKTLFDGLGGSSDAEASAIATL